MLEIAIIVLLIVLIVISILILTMINKNGDGRKILALQSRIDIIVSKLDTNMAVSSSENKNVKDDLKNQLDSLTKNVNDSLKNNIELLNMNNESQNKRLDKIDVTISSKLKDIQENNQNKIMDMQKHVDKIDETVSKKLTELQESNQKKLNDMQHMVDEKLQETLENRIKKSFDSVSKNLESVQKGLGEMQAIATDVGGLKKVLSNVKSRGIIGEASLRAILDDIMTKNQYVENIATVKGSNNRVEFAIKLPNNSDNDCVYLPIDSKFPLDTYSTLLDAYDTGDKLKINMAAKALENRMLQEAKDIHDKYIFVPETTEFGIMFLPTEGLYAEAINRGYIDVIQSRYHINVCGPSTMGAFLNSLQMGFKTLQIEKRASEIGTVLGAVKSEFSNFNDALALHQKQLKTAQKSLDNIIGTRTNQMNRALRNVEISQNNQEAKEIIAKFSTNYDDID